MAEEKQQLKTLLTRRMELRSFCMEDLDDFHALCSQKEVMLPAGFSVSKDLEESKNTLNSAANVRRCGLSATVPLIG